MGRVSKARFSPPVGQDRDRRALVEPAPGSPRQPARAPHRTPRLRARTLAPPTSRRCPIPPSQPARGFCGTPAHGRLSYWDVTTAFPLHRYTMDDYLRLEEESSTRHEFLEGEIVAMAGGTPEHAALAMAVGRQLGNQLEGTNCRVFSSDLRVGVVETGLITYPDVTVVCGPSERDPRSATIVINPALVVEVTSDSTEHYDRGAKLEHYMKIQSLRAVVIISHREKRVDVYERSGNDWSHRSSEPGAQALARAIGVTLDLEALYAAAEEPS